jgi:hypothetical protein
MTDGNMGVLPQVHSACIGCAAYFLFITIMDGIGWSSECLLRMRNNKLL